MNMHYGSRWRTEILRTSQARIKQLLSGGGGQKIYYVKAVLGG